MFQTSAGTAGAPALPSPTENSSRANNQAKSDFSAFNQSTDKPAAVARQSSVRHITAVAQTGAGGFAVSSAALQQLIQNERSVSSAGISSGPASGNTGGAAAASTVSAHAQSGSALAASMKPNGGGRTLARSYVFGRDCENSRDASSRSEVSVDCITLSVDVVHVISRGSCHPAFQASNSNTAGAASRAGTSAGGAGSSGTASLGKPAAAAAPLNFSKFIGANQFTSRADNAPVATKPSMCLSSALARSSSATDSTGSKGKPLSRKASTTK